MKRARVTQELAYGAALDRLTGTDKPTSVPSKGETNQKPRNPMIKLSVFLGRKEDAYLENLASTAKFSGGKKLSKTKLIEAMVRAFGNSKVDVRGVKTDEELFERVVAQLRQ